MTKLTLIASIAVVLAVPLSLSAQNPLVQSLKSVFDITKSNIMATAEILDDEMYTFRPTDEVRSAGEILAHIADGQFSICGIAVGKPTPVPKTSKRREPTRRRSLQHSSRALHTANASSRGPAMRGRLMLPTSSGLQTPSAVCSPSTPFTTTSTMATW